MWQFFYESRTTTTLTPVLDCSVTRHAWPHIYAGVGFRIVYSIRVCHNLLLDKRDGSTLSFYVATEVN